MASSSRSRPGQPSRHNVEDLKDALSRTRAEHREQRERRLDRNAELERALALYTSLFLDAPIGCVTFDRKGIVVQANRAGARLLGTNLTRPVGKPFIVFVHPRDARLFQAHLVNCRRNDRAQTELHLRRNGGEPRPVDLVSRLAFAPGIDRPIYQTVINDIETAQERDRALALSEKRYREIVETANEGICIVDQHNDIVFANRRLGAMVGQSSDDLVGRSAYDLLPDEDRGRALEDFARRKAPEDDIRLIRADGRTVWVSLSTSVLRDQHGRFTGMLRMYADASARHELAVSRQTVMRELMAAQERERTRIARELHDQMGQHIVALALGVAKLTRITERLEEAQPVLVHLREIADLLGRDVHTLAFELRPAALDHLGLAVALTSYGEHVADRSGVDIDVHCDDLTSLNLSGAAQTGLYRIAQEAITNAVKHARAKRVSVILEQRADALVLIVEDDGVGLRQPVATSSTVYGVGVTGMRERATLLGGSLSIESSSGHGTTVYARIPLASQADEKREQTPTAPR